MNFSLRSLARLSRLTFAGALTLPLLAACGSDDDAAVYGVDGDVTTVLGDGKGGYAQRSPGADACLEIKITGECVTPENRCPQGQRADVIVDSAGKIVEIICYRDGSAEEPTESDGDLDRGKDNGGTIVLDGDADGADIKGDLTSAGNNFTVLGQGPDVSKIEGDVKMTGNNFSTRAVHITGSVEVTANNGTMVLSVVDGDVTFNGNNFVMAETTVRGNLTINGNNAKLVANRVGGTLTVNGDGAVCDSNQKLASDGSTSPLSCGQ